VNYTKNLFNLSFYIP